MLSHEITKNAGKNKAPSRIGRGRGSGNGKTAGRGHKGQKSRSGHSRKAMFAGGNIPVFRRLPRVGFSNYHFANNYEIVNVVQLEKYFEDGSTVGVEQLAEHGLVGSSASRVKILGDGQLTKKLTVQAHKFSKSAQEKISSCGGTASVVA
ncbi:50S ribosomal protein L15 [Sedimentisphaera salicampi]|uniref:Large ribosomal subunit protein uL15 n=1 Tax=Sedimentisphaera salicampi TaxID=1941349 RepID=A0A1W6LPH5_9BACT|nr:50S ribosomal protein L15 [Sedimentisphaera salicampi]ARN57667.1 50S ribosomal protein L15 [Sedimentisphaera salicampi]OXU14232.1 50S ribosomal protein L15 [Sedimentisphaera salicampi]